MGKKKSSTEGAETEAAAMQTISRALADPKRFQVLHMIANCNAASCMEVRQTLRIRPATLSHHMKQLEEAGLIETARDGKYVRAQLRRKTWKSYLLYLKQIAG